MAYDVPQGNVLEHSLILYIHDVYNTLIEQAKIFSYADETVIIFAGNTSINIRNSTEQGMGRVTK